MTDTLQSNILTVDAQGNVGVVLQGGITIPVTETDPPSFADAVTFERGNGTDAGQIYLDDAGGPQIVVKATADPSALAPASVGIRLSGSGGSATALLLEDNGASSFLQLALAGQLQLDGGTANMPFAGTSGPVTVVVNHSLGRVPARVTATYDYAGNGGLFLYAQARTTTTITFRGVATAVVAGNVGFDWNALG